MTTTTVAATQGGSYTIHDTWTELYVGIHHLVYRMLPAPGERVKSEDRAMCQLALVASNQLMEIALYRLLTPLAQQEGNIDKLRKNSYSDMLTKWVPNACGKSLDLQSDPFLSTELLRERRNDTIHKTSSPVSIPVARAALSTAVCGCVALHTHFGQQFPYVGFLERWELPREILMSSIDE